MLPHSIIFYAFHFVNFVFRFVSRRMRPIKLGCKSCQVCISCIRMIRRFNLLLFWGVPCVSSCMMYIYLNVFSYNTYIIPGSTNNGFESMLCKYFFPTVYSFAPDCLGACSVTTGTRFRTWVNERTATYVPVQGSNSAAKPDGSSIQTGGSSIRLVRLSLPCLVPYSFV